MIGLIVSRSVTTSVTFQSKCDWRVTTTTRPRATQQGRVKCRPHVTVQDVHFSVYSCFMFLASTSWLRQDSRHQTGSSHSRGRNYHQLDRVESTLWRRRITRRISQGSTLELLEPFWSWACDLLVRVHWRFGPQADQRARNPGKTILA